MTRHRDASPPATTDQAPPPRPCECATNFAGLRASIGRIYQKNGADYHTAEQCISALLERVGPHNFDFTLLERWREEESDEVCILAELTVRFWAHDPNDEGYVLHTVTRQDIGAQQIKRHRTSRLALSIGDDYKAAASDAFKRCVRLIGIGLDVWEKEPRLPYKRSDEEEEERARATQARPVHSDASDVPAEPPPDASRPRALPSAPAPVQLGAGDRAGYEHEYTSLLERARDGGFRASWVNQELSKLSDAQLVKYVELLRGRVSGARAS